MRRLAWIAILLLSTAPAAAHPSFVPRLLETTWVQAEAGWSYALAAATSEGPRLLFARSVAPRIDVVAELSGADRLRLAARLLVIRDLLPLNVSAELGSDGAVAVRGTLLLGPVHVAFGRSWWGSHDRGFGLVELASRSDFSLTFGVEAASGRIAPIIGFCVVPFRDAMVAISFSFSVSGAAVSIGGVW